DAEDIVYHGFRDEGAGLIEENDPVGGAVRNRADALSILEDTYAALMDMLDLAKLDSFELTPEVICGLHKKPMKTCQVMSCSTPKGSTISYTNIGVTRQMSRVNVVIKSKDTNIQFCPWDEVDEELKTFCSRFNVPILDAASSNIGKLTMNC
ncbi:hypothetical protein H0H81_012006, partial [Sphagnurus paluster]